MASSMLFLCFSFLLPSPYFVFFFFNDPPTPEISPLSLHDALPISGGAAGPVTYGPGAARFAGATFDPTSHYRAARVFDFFEELELTPDLLRQVSLHQVGLLAGL